MNSTAGGQAVGRTPLLAGVSRWLTPALAGHGRAVLLTGEPGITRSTLVQAVCSWRPRQEISACGLPGYAPAQAAEGVEQPITCLAGQALVLLVICPSVRGAGGTVTSAKVQVLGMVVLPASSRAGTVSGDYRRRGSDERTTLDRRLYANAE
jgi:hypothetical protein